MAAVVRLRNDFDAFVAFGSSRNGRKMVHKRAGFWLWLRSMMAARAVTRPKSAGSGSGCPRLGVAVQRSGRGSAFASFADRSAVVPA